MRLALLADIHGNLVALDAVLADLASERIDAFLCLGDVAALGPAPRAVLARLRELRCPCVRGNTDDWHLDPALLDARRGNPALAAMVGLADWGNTQLTADDRAFLASFPLTRRVGLGAGVTLLAAHAAPHDNEAIVSATTPGDALDGILSGHPATLYASGHTHLQLLRRHRDWRLLNPGSVGLPGTGPGTPGLPVNVDVCWAEYAVLDVDDATGRLALDLRRVPLDPAALRASVLASGMPHAAWWLALWRAEVGFAVDSARGGSTNG